LESEAGITVSVLQLWIRLWKLKGENLFILNVMDETDTENEITDIKNKGYVVGSAVNPTLPKAGSYMRGHSFTFSIKGDIEEHTLHTGQKANTPGDGLHIM
jgi:hypothetical protein